MLIVEEAKWIDRPPTESEIVSYTKQADEYAKNGLIEEFMRICLDLGWEPTEKAWLWLITGAIQNKRLGDFLQILEDRGRPLSLEEIEWCNQLYRDNVSLQKT
jgi:hypothetical protein